MFTKTGSTAESLSAEYHEESIRMPALITVILLLLVIIPLGTWIYRIDAAGKVSANISKYETLVASVDQDVGIVNAILSNDAREMESLIAARRAGTVRLIVPEVVIVEKRDDTKKVQSELNIELDGIYWSPANPLVTIDGQTYRKGEQVQGYEIVEIGKRSVTFKSRDGKLIEKDMYEDLLQ